MTIMLDRIRASIPALPPAEQRVAKLVLSDPRSFASTPVGELAERAHVSKPTVVRFCRSVGYDGLADFKLKLAGTVNEGVPFVHRSVDEDDGPGELIVKVIDNAVSAMLKYRNITASASPLAQMTQAHSQILLAADHPEDFDRYSPMVSRMLHLMIIDILTTGVALRLGQGLRPALQEIKRNLRARRYATPE